MFGVSINVWHLFKYVFVFCFIVRAYRSNTNINKINNIAAIMSVPVKVILLLNIFTNVVSIGTDLFILLAFDDAIDDAIVECRGPNPLTNKCFTKNNFRFFDCLK